jgi:hypothetical protein
VAVKTAETQTEYLMAEESEMAAPHYPLDRRLGEPQCQSGCSGEEK